MWLVRGTCVLFGSLFLMKICICSGEFVQPINVNMILAVWKFYLLNGANCQAFWKMIVDLFTNYVSIFRWHESLRWPNAVLYTRMRKGLNGINFFFFEVVNPCIVVLQSRSTDKWQFIKTLILKNSCSCILQIQQCPIFCITKSLRFHIEHS